MQRAAQVVSRISLALATILILMAGDIAPAQSGAPKAKAEQKSAKPAGQAEQKQQNPGWSVRCNNPGKTLQCRAFQNVFISKTGQLLVGASVSRPDKAKPGALTVQLPLGLFNPAGAAISIDGSKADTLPIQTCDKSGCFAGLSLTAEKLASLTKGKELKVVFQNLKKKAFTVAIPLKGFGDAYKKL